MKIFAPVTAAMLIAAAAPAFSQAAPPAPTGAAAPAEAGRMRRHRGELFANLSPAGRQTLREALRDVREDRDQASLRTARERVLALLEAEQLDVGALRTAQNQERSIVEANHRARQEAMIGAYQKLSLADRRALVASMRDMEKRMREQILRMHGGNGAKER